MVRVKKNATIRKDFLPLFDKKSHTSLLWFVWEALGYGIAALFGECAAIFAKCATFSRQKAP